MASEADDVSFTAPSKKHVTKNSPEQMEKSQALNQCSGLHSDNSITTGQTSSNTNTNLSPSQQEAISHLLKICAGNNVAINPHLRKAILGEELYDETICRGSITSGSLSTRESLLESLIASHLTDLEEEGLGDTARKVREKMNELEDNTISVEARVKNGKYTVKIPASSKSGTIQTVATGSALIKLVNKVRNLFKKDYEGPKEETKVIMEGVNLCLEEGKMYLVLGAPGCGKSTLLKMIAGLLPKNSKSSISGSVSINGVESTEKNLVWSNIVAYIDQIDRLHGYLTVKETMQFAWDCRNAGTHCSPRFKQDVNDADIKKLVAELDEEGWLVNLVLDAIGLTRVKDTFVGNDKVRGVSGGQRKRVTVGEMMCVSSQVQMFDEISTGLDASTTYDIIKLMGEVTRLKKNIKLVSLLQPPPETVALFDEIILLDKGRILFAGPIDKVTSYFKSLGYQQPDRMDLADWLQSLPTKDGANYMAPSVGGEERKHLTNDEFFQKFNESEELKVILAKLEIPVSREKMSFMENPMFRQRYANTALRSIQILFKREFTLWWRDVYARRARLFQDLFMGIIVGTVFWQTDDPQTAMGVIFQCVFFISLGAMLKVGPQIDVRGIFYKEQDANFYTTWTYVLARACAGLPTSIQDSLVYGSLVYWMAGFTVSASNYFVFLLLTLLAAFTCGLMFSVFSATIKDRPTAQAAMSIALVVMVLFSGFTVQPNVIPDYYIWIYWMNMFAWVIRCVQEMGHVYFIISDMAYKTLFISYLILLMRQSAVAINEYQSDEYNEVISEDGTTEGEMILSIFGFTLNGEPFEYVWVWWTVMFCIGLCIASIMSSVWCLNHVRYTTGKAAGRAVIKEEKKKNNMKGSQKVTLPVRGATLTFEDIHYTVTASTSKDKLHLLKGVSGYFASGKMTALMGSSGAGKTTLMDVLSLRKHSGEVTGNIYINGFPQEPNSFRRCTGYVEQFDTQSPQLTIRETVEFSAIMRLDESIPLETKQKFVDQVLEMLELDEEANLLVGSDSIGGLSFEQKKRLSIAVELASNPSIIFLDEPTSGLDARAAGIVMRGMRRIADTGIAVVATIHQPSVAIFNDFDNLLLLKAGGETVFFGDLGYESCKLINYLEGYEATVPIKVEENPGTWMLSCIGAGSAAILDSFDYARAYVNSPLASDCIEKIQKYNENPVENNKISFLSKYATSTKFQRSTVYKRLSTIYWRSPGYNRVRLLVSAIVALLFGSVFASQRVPQTEGDMNSRVTSIYITALFLAVNAQNTVLPVFEMERNMFYKHKAVLMYDQRAINLAFFLCEIPFIALASMIFCCLWYFTVGFAINVAKFFWYYLFMTFSLAIYTYMGQALMSLFRDAVTAQGMGAIFIAMSSIFGGILIRPQLITNFWIWAYWLFPLHYILEGLISSQFENDNTPITSSYGTAYYEYVRETYCPEASVSTVLPSDCTGTAEEWLYISFGGWWVPEHLPWNVLYLLGVIILSKCLSLYGLTSKNYLAT